ncbi:MAG: LysR family transcriptional regulator [Gammaproteobacteria bacterium]|nr:LysR family transcriptional regulator [Gammaproteobacteria bacterium]
MDFNKAKTFIEVVDSGSITKAANSLFRTQQAISLQLKALEEELELTLFDRQGARIVLTQQGEQLYDEFKAAFIQMESSVYRMKSDKTSATGTIRLGLCMEQSTGYLPYIVTAFKKKFPKVNFEVLLGIDVDLEKALLNNDIDFGFYVFVQNKKLIETQPVLCRKLILVASNEYLLKKKPVKTIEDTLSLSLVDYSQDYASYAAWIKENARSLLPRARKKIPLVTVMNDLVLKELVRQGHGMALLPEEIVKEELATGSIIQLLPKKSKAITLTIDLGYKKRRTHSYLHEAFLNFVISEKNLWM